MNFVPLSKYSDDEKSIVKVSFFLLVVKISVNDVVFIRCGSRPLHIKSWRSNCGARLENIWRKKKDSSKIPIDMVENILKHHRNAQKTMFCFQS